ncbi:MAG: hypothetical protein IJW29_08555 [Clostridia bacterium]|nr:hypothetical protein [Clostridia bacterium]
MAKRLLALIEVLMAISIFCTGYATWSYVKQTSAYATGSAMFEAFDSERENVEIGLDDFGITMTTSITGVGSSQTFQYKTVTAGSTTTEAFTSTTLSVLFKVNIDTMAACESQDYRKESLKVTCTAAEYQAYNETYADKTFAEADANGTIGVGAWLTLSDAVLKVAGYPNVSRTVSVSINASGVLEITIPLSELYNLLLPCEKGSVTEGGQTYLPVTLEINFTHTGKSDPSSSTDSLKRPCGWRYTYAAQLTPNA